MLNNTGYTKNTTHMYKPRYSHLVDYTTPT